MKVMIALALVAAGAAQAQTAEISFGPATSCPTYCTGFTTDDPDYTLDWLNATSALAQPPHTLLSLNGVVFSGDTFQTLISIIGTHYYYKVVGTLVSQSGGSMDLEYMLDYWTTKTVSGRLAGMRVPHRMVDSGKISLN